ncbi:MAG: hypothetical protein Q7S06_01265 [Nanoarchaeota archaeon]|nr:hypothetical protein [Nanoarchaeota archaeon]
MLVSQVLLTFWTIKRCPGLTLDELSNKVNELYGNEEAAKWLVHGDEEHWLLSARIRELDCIEVKDNRYYFKEAQPYSKDKLINYFIEQSLLKMKDKP